MASFVVDIRLQGRRCLVLGGDAVAFRRVESLREAGAQVDVIAPELCAPLQAMVQEQKIGWPNHSFAAADAGGYFLVLVAAALGDELASVVHDIRSSGALVHVADQPQYCDFFFGALHTSGALTISVHTDGRAPGLASKIRDAVVAKIDPGWGDEIERFGLLRRQVQLLSPHVPADERMAFLRSVLEHAHVYDLGDASVRQELIATFLRGEALPTGQREGPGRVWFVGAGPGDPELLTLKAARLIGRCDALVVDALVPPALYREARGQIYFAGKRAQGVHTLQAHINALLVELGKRGQEVVRLKGGDPALFARLGEEIDALSGAGISYEIVPGVASPQAVAAALGTPLTERALVDEVVVMHAAPRRDQEFELPNYNSRRTVIVLMGKSEIADIVKVSLAKGYPPTCPMACVVSASLPEQSKVVTTLAQFNTKMLGGEASGPMTLVIGHTLMRGEAAEKWQRGAM